MAAGRDPGKIRGMNMAKHTEAPWRVSEGSPDIGIVTDKVLVAMVPKDEDSPCTDEEQAANAALIAAAPDLLAACKQFAAYADSGKHPRFKSYLDTIAGAKMRTALAKASNL